MVVEQRGCIPVGRRETGESVKINQIYLIYFLQYFTPILNSVTARLQYDALRVRIYHLLTKLQNIL